MTKPVQKERDPHGKQPGQAGAKLDLGKPLAGLLIKDFGRALLAISEVTTFGAEKYTPSGWRDVPDGKQRYFEAAIRHLLAVGTQELDEESGFGHLEHAAWNLLAVIELRHQGDDISKKLAELLCCECGNSLVGIPSIVEYEVRLGNRIPLRFCEDCRESFILNSKVKIGGTD